MGWSKSLSDSTPIPSGYFCQYQFKGTPGVYPLLYLNRSVPETKINNEFVVFENFYRDRESDDIQVERVGDFQIRGKVTESSE